MFLGRLTDVKRDFKKGLQKARYVKRFLSALYVNSFFYMNWSGRQWTACKSRSIYVCICI